MGRYGCGGRVGGQEADDKKRLTPLLLNAGLGSSKSC